VSSDTLFTYENIKNIITAHGYNELIGILVPIENTVKPRTKLEMCKIIYLFWCPVLLIKNVAGIHRSSTAQRTNDTPPKMFIYRRKIVFSLKRSETHCKQEQ